MSFAIKLVPSVEKFLSKLPNDLTRRILDKLESIEENPFHYLEHFEGEGYKLRIGEYRALIDVDHSQKILKVRVIEHRSRVYKN